MLAEAQTHLEIPQQRTVASEPLKCVTVEQFQLMLRIAAAQPGLSVEFVNALKAAAWFVEVVAFRDVEESFVAEGTHRAYLAELIAVGEGLILAARRQGIALGPEFFFTLEDMEAALDSLHTTFRCEHGPKNSDKTNELIQRLFDGSKS
jgi:hypothetical protein